MGLNNINALQHPEDVAYLTSNVSKDYYIHALANMGQRMGLFDDTAIRYNVITFDEDVEISSRTENVFTFESDLTFDITINNIETYKKQSQILNDGHSFKMLLFGKLLGTENSDKDNVEIQYTDIDIDNNIITRAIRAFNIKNNVFVLLDIEKNDTIYDNHIEYTFKCYSITLNDTVISDNNIRKWFTSSTYDNKNQTFFKENEDLIGILNIINNEGLFGTLIAKSIYNESVINNNYTLSLYYDTLGEKSERYISIPDTTKLSKTYENIHDLLYFDVYGLDKRINIFNIDLAKIYPNILKYYSNTRFNLNNESLRTIIAQTIYNELYYEYYSYRIVNEANDNYIEPILTIKAGAQIIYLSKVDDALKIYFTNDIYISLKNIYDFSDENNSISFLYDGYTKTSVYNISVNYNKTYPELIDTMVMYKKFSLPFINDSKYWEINDISTSNYALGESAGTPNIIITKTYYDNGKIISKKLNRFDIYDEDIEYYNVNQKINDKYYIFMIPKINDPKIYKYANLIVISNVTKIQNSNKLEESYITDVPITTLWTINEDNTEFVLLKDLTKEGDDIIDINSLLSIDSHVYDTLKKFDHTSNCFKDLMALTLYNNMLTNDTLSMNMIDSYRYFTISQDTGKYNYSLPESEQNYNVVKIRIDDYPEYDDIYKTHIKNTYKRNQQYYINLSKKSTNSKYSYTVEKMIADMVIESDHTVENSSIMTNNSTNSVPRLLGTSATVSSSSPSTSVTTTNLNTGASTTTSDSAAVSNAEQTWNNIYNTIHGNTNNEQSESVINILKREYGAVDVDVNIKNGNKVYDFEFNYYEYLPAAYVPTINLSEMLCQDVNIINRTNIISFDENNNKYYAYIGTSFDEKQKNTLHIGSQSLNINAGTDTLFPKNYSFQSHNTLSLDFNNINIGNKQGNIKLNNNVEFTYSPIIDVNNNIFTISLTSISSDFAEKIVCSSVDNGNEVIIEKTISDIEDTFVRFVGFNLPNGTAFNTKFLNEINKYLSPNNQLTGISAINSPYKNTHNNVLSWSSWDNKWTMIEGTMVNNNNNKILLLDEPWVIHIIKTDNHTCTASFKVKLTN